MLLRILLVITIVAGLAACAVGFIQVKDIIVTTRAARDDFHQKYTSETTARKTAETKLKKSQADLAETTSKLNDTQSQLEAANTKNTELTTQNTDLTAKLTKMTDRADTAEQKLEQWNQLPPPEAIKGMISDLAKTKQARDAVVAENKLLLASRKDLQERWNRIFGADAPVILPTGLRGKILAVDPKYDFVVLNIGDEQGAKERGEMMVEKHGRLLGKVRISTVRKDTCVANILPGWQRGEIMEGDQVIY
jgi:flagellar biosynthesis/type III secretory pathway chaperone